MRKAFNLNKEEINYVNSILKEIKEGQGVNENEVLLQLFKDNELKMKTGEVASIVPGDMGRIFSEDVEKLSASLDTIRSLFIGQMSSISLKIEDKEKKLQKIHEYEINEVREYLQRKINELSSQINHAEAIVRRN